MQKFQSLIGTVQHCRRFTMESQRPSFNHSQIRFNAKMTIFCLVRFLSFNLSQVRFNEFVDYYYQAPKNARFNPSQVRFNKKNNVVPFRKRRMFQSLIGTVQQQCLLRFMFSLYLISTVFQSFSPKKSVNLFMVNSRKALA